MLVLGNEETELDLKLTKDDYESGEDNNCLDPCYSDCKQEKPLFTQAHISSYVAKLSQSDHQLEQAAISRLSSLHQLAHVLKHKYKLWKKELISDVDSLEPKLKSKLQEYQHYSVKIGQQSVKPDAFALLEGVRDFWKEFLWKNVPKNINEVKHTAAKLWRECMLEIRIQSDSSASDKIRFKDMIEV